MAAVRWLPLESNPEVMNQFIKYLGVPPKWNIVDVFSLDDELLALVPQPVLAVMLLFPTSEKQEEFGKKQENDMMTSGTNVSDKLYFMKQTIRNACGTVALIHAVANNLDQMNLAGDSPLQKFLTLTKEMSPEERGVELESNMDIGAVHASCAQKGQTETPNIDDDVFLHFVAFVNSGGQLCELDGRRSVPIVHGPTTNESLLKDSSKICKEYMKRDPENLRFTVLALGPAAS